ncbi:unnamed protein product [Medioppia subpectinata]|uniref:Uncharacterized protein n=1 Tax=Medioppia subpectinata TaxID=1979941 RepID=A0A7R9Q0I6_9ACAR|nr:unnamed protein product [Medioppia subpectinata]CAG2107343.1 unnamed protein product [Medioppia subpectinata]
MYLKTALVCVVLAICPLVSHAAIYSCYSGSIPGCTCTAGWNAADFNYKVVVSCAGTVGSAADFGDSLRIKTKGYQFDDFIISAYPNARLPDAPFHESTTIKRIIIKDSPKLEGFGAKAKPDTGLFNNLGKSLETLVLSNNPAIKMTEWQNIATQLKSAGTVREDELPVAGAINLKTLVIHKSPEFDDLETLKDLAPTLNVLVLRANGFTTFNYVLDDYKELITLDLSETPALKKFVLKTKPDKLTNIFLSTCGLDILTVTTLEELMKAGFVDFTKNKLDCDCSNLPEKFIDPDNEKRFLGSLCATPNELNNKQYGSTCIYKSFFLSGQTSLVYAKKP